MEVIKQVTLVKFSVGQNENKVWRGEVFRGGATDNAVFGTVVRWGRVGAKLSEKSGSAWSAEGAQMLLAEQVKDKCSKGYVKVDLLTDRFIDPEHSTPIGLPTLQVVDRAQEFLLKIRIGYELHLAESYYSLLPKVFPGRTLPHSPLSYVDQLELEQQRLNRIKEASQTWKQQRLYPLPSEPELSLEEQIALEFAGVEEMMANYRAKMR